MKIEVENGRKKASMLMEKYPGEKEASREMHEDDMRMAATLSLLKNFRIECSFNAFATAST